MAVNTGVYSVQVGFIRHSEFGPGEGFDDNYPAHLQLSGLSPETFRRYIAEINEAWFAGHQVFHPCQAVLCCCGCARINWGEADKRVRSAIRRINEEAAPVNFAYYYEVGRGVGPKLIINWATVTNQ